MVRYVRMRILAEHRPLVTVIVAFSNDARFVDGTIDRLSALSYPNLEILLVDDGSTDATATLLEQRVGSLPAARLLRNEANLGVAASRNRAIAEATGEYLWFADCDDTWHPSIISSLVDALADKVREHDIAICVANVETGDGIITRAIDAIETRHVLRGDETLLAILRGEVDGYLWTKLLRRSLVATFPEQRSLSDLPFVAAAMASSTSVVHIPERLYTYVQREGSITSSRPVDLDDLARTTSAVLALASGAPANLVTAFRYSNLVLPAHTQWALRRESPRPQVAGVDVRVRVRDIRRVFANNRRTALKALWIWAAGPLFAPSYRALTGGRHG